MAKTFMHSGPYQTITADCSPGLRFLREFLPALDSLEPASNPITPYLSPSAQFIINGGDPTPAAVIVAMFRARSEKVQVFRHMVKSAWDLEKADGKRTVMYESVSVTVVKGDPDGRTIEIPEFNVIELESVKGGCGGLGAYELRCYMDTQPVVQHMKQVDRNSA